MKKNILHFEILSPYFNCENVDNYLEQFNKYEKLCKLIKKTKSKFRSARFKANIVKIGNYFLNKDFKISKMVGDV